MSPDGPVSAHAGTILALDVDGVLLDPQRGGHGPWQVAFGARFGVDAAGLDGTLFAAPWGEVITGRQPIAPALTEAIRELGWTMDVEDALACWFEEDFVVDPVVLSAAATWSKAGVPLALVSNQEPRRARYLHQRLASMLPIAGTAFSGDLGAMKGDLGFYAQAEQRLGLGADPSVVFLDDTAGNVAVASRHGWNAIHFTKGGDWQSQVTAALAHSPGGPAPA